MRRRYAITAGLLLLTAALAAIPADGRRSPSPLMVAAPGGSANQNLQRGPVVAPVRRKTPETPPFPEAIVLAGDVVEPSRAPDDAPAPSRRDAAVAALHLAADHAAKSSMTITAQDQGAAATTAE